MNEDHDFPITELIGKLLTSVSFVMDYLKLQFEHPVLTVLTTVTVLNHQVATGTSTAGYADALYRQIGKAVSHVRLVPKQEIRITFNDRSEILVSLTAKNHAGPELAMFELPPDGLWVLREN